MAFTSFETAYNEMHRALAGLEDETEGCMVLDCGATKTFGSIKALEKIVEKTTSRRHGHEQRDGGRDGSA